MGTLQLCIIHNFVISVNFIYQNVQYQIPLKLCDIAWNKVQKERDLTRYDIFWEATFLTTSILFNVQYSQIHGPRQTESFLTHAQFFP